MSGAGSEAPPSGLGFEVVGGTELRLSGTLTGEPAQAYLGRRLTALHETIVKSGARSFRVDVRRLVFVNSSAIRVFVDWTSRAEASGYRLVFLTDHAITWHRLSFSVLKSLAPSAVEVVPSGAKSAADTGRA